MRSSGMDEVYRQGVNGEPTHQGYNSQPTANASTSLCLPLFLNQAHDLAAYTDVESGYMDTDTN